MENTYWNSKGTHQDLIEKIQDLVPASGECSLKYTKNKALEKFRKASNAYYDIFNNGGGNRMKSISKIFGSEVTHCLRVLGDRYYRNDSTAIWNRIHLDAEPKMDAIILAAAKEQGLL